MRYQRKPTFPQSEKLFHDQQIYEKDHNSTLLTQPTEKLLTVKEYGNQFFANISSSIAMRPLTVLLDIPTRPILFKN